MVDIIVAPCSYNLKSRSREFFRHFMTFFDRFSPRKKLIALSFIIDFSDFKNRFLLSAVLKVL
jgi:hypothetical protein